MQEWTTDSKSSKHPAPPYIWLLVGFGAAAFLANLLGACGACCRNMCLLSWGASISETILFWQVRHGQSWPTRPRTMMAVFTDQRETARARARERASYRGAHLRTRAENKHGTVRGSKQGQLADFACRVQIILALLLFFNPEAVDTQICAVDDKKCIKEVDTLFR